jgi:DNA-binding HxlR family transcriptional regulator/putative sterol carrier protein
VRSVSRRTYDQYCSISRALDVLGERWSLLVIRELLVGPKRFSDLQDGLAGIGANALSARLKALEADGLVVKRRLPPPAASTVYELTERGRALEPTLLELARWGMPLLGSPTRGESFRPGWLLTGLRAVFDPERAAGVRRTYVLKVDGEAFSVRIDDGAIEVEQGEESAADVAVAMDSQTLLAIGAGTLCAEEAMESGAAVVEKGDPAEVVALVGMLQLPAADAAQV